GQDAYRRRLRAPDLGDERACRRPDAGRLPDGGRLSPLRRPSDRQAFHRLRPHADAGPGRATAAARHLRRTRRPAVLSPPAPPGPPLAPPSRGPAGGAPPPRMPNLPGPPAMSPPLYGNDEGMPMGSRFVGRLGEEAPLFGRAAQRKRARPGADPRPPVSA